MGVRPPAAESPCAAAGGLVVAGCAREPHAPRQLCWWDRVLSLQVQQVSLALDTLYMVRVLLFVRSPETNFHPNRKASLPFRDI